MTANPVSTETFLTADVLGAVGELLVRAEAAAAARDAMGAVSHDDVVAMLAAATTVTAAAAAAVGAALTNAGVLSGVKPLSVDGLSFMFTDQTGQYSWLAADLAGGPAPHSLAMIASGLNIAGQIASALSSVGALTGVKPLTESSLSLAFTDALGQRSDFELDLAGHVTDRVLALWQTRMSSLPAASSVIPELAASGKVYLADPVVGTRTYLGTVAGASNPKLLSPSAVSVETSGGQKWVSTTSPTPGPVFPSNIIVCDGDSQTYGTTRAVSGTGPYFQANPSYPQVLATDLGMTVMNFGVGGQGSAEIATRQGGLRPLLTLTGNQIPASTADTAVTTISPVDGWTTAADFTGLPCHGTLMGVAGNLNHSAAGGVHTFTFTADSAPGAPVSVPPGTPFIGDQGANYRDAIQIIWAGYNNLSQVAAIKRDIASMVAAKTEFSKRYLIVGSFASGTLLTDLAALYGPRFVNLRAYLSANGLAAAGITATSADTAAMAAGNIPPSLLVDVVHFTQAGYAVIGHYLASIITALNWQI